MSIAEKLIIIAENMKKVYDAGFAAGQAQGGGGSDGMVSFEVDGETYSAPQGMTWSEFINSEYNPMYGCPQCGESVPFFHIKEGSFVAAQCCDDRLVLNNDEDASPVDANEVITSAGYLLE